MVQGIGKVFGDMITILIIVCCISVPLGLWKIVEIIIWLVKHLSISIK